MLDLDDTPEAERHEASSYPTRLVWLLSFLALYTTFIMVTIVWWTLVDVRSEREKQAGRQNEVSTIRNRLEARIENEKWDISAFLDGHEPAAAADRDKLPELIADYQEAVGHREEKQTYAPLEAVGTSDFPPSDQLPDLIATYKEAIGSQEQKPLFAAFETISADLARLRDRCQQWSARYRDTMARLTDMRGQVAEILRRMEASHGLTAGSNATPGLIGVIRDIHELNLLRVTIQHEEDPRTLERLRDDAIRPVLARLLSQTGNQRQGDFLPPGLAEELAIALFGQGYRFDDKAGMVIPGSGSHLYGFCADRMLLGRERELLRGDLLGTTRRAHETVQKIADQAASSLKQESQSVESAIRRALHIILIVGVATAAIFLAISYKIISEIKSQIRAIENSNKMLDNRTKALVKSEDALRKSEERLQFLSSNLLTAQEKERRRIAHELHDELGQSMAALKLQVGAIERRAPSLSSAAVREECHAIRDHINEIIENVRRLSKDLSPVVIDDLGLEAAIEYLATNFAQLHTMAVTIELPDINPLFSQDSQRLIYRIIQEALTNISKHAQASHITILAERKDDLVTFMVHDDGVGFDLEEVIEQDSTAKGMGLTTMAERVRILGGSIDFRSRPGLGATITFTAPIYRRPAPESV